MTTTVIGERLIISRFLPFAYAFNSFCSVQILFKNSGRSGAHISSDSCVIRVNGAD
jgi:hypothetical protein